MARTREVAITAALFLLGAAVAQGAAKSKIQHVVIVVQENHTFDNYFGQYCKAPTGSHPSCHTGPACCEAGPAKLGAVSPVVLDDAENGRIDRNHTHACELAEMDHGKMDRYVSGAAEPDCSSPANFAYAPAKLIQPYLDWAGKYALADRYFQSAIGQTSMNDMFLAQAAFVFLDNSAVPDAVGKHCGGKNPNVQDFASATIADLLNKAGVSWAFYAQGYGLAKAADPKGPPYNPEKAQGCPVSDPLCPDSLYKKTNHYPCTYDPTDDPFNYYPSLGHDNPTNFRDFDGQFAADVDKGQLPAISWVKAIGYRTEHPDAGVRISDGVAFMTGVFATLEANPAIAASTLLLFTYDEGGGFYDHVAPPRTFVRDHGGNGTRVPFLALGPFARRNYISHVVMEHSSIVKFIEWNWLGGTGQLGARDRTVNGIGSLLDPNLGVP